MDIDPALVPVPIPVPVTVPVPALVPAPVPVPVMCGFVILPVLMAIPERRGGLGLVNGLGVALDDAELTADRFPKEEMPVTFGKPETSRGGGALGGLVLGEETGLCKGVDCALVVPLPRFAAVRSVAVACGVFSVLLARSVGLELGVVMGLFSEVI